VGAEIGRLFKETMASRTKVHRHAPKEKIAASMRSGNAHRVSEAGAQEQEKQSLERVYQNGAEKVNGRSFGVLIGPRTCR
jgi:hypothetical protein